jgi:hypothetical protein
LQILKLIQNFPAEVHLSSWFLCPIWAIFIKTTKVTSKKHQHQNLNIWKK